MKIQIAKLQKWVPLLVLSSALMIIIIDTTVLNVSIRNMISDLSTNVQGIQWVISAYSLTLAALTVTGGRLGDLFGRKRMFMLGAILFAVGSLITSIAPNIGWVIFGNAFVEGVGAALMMPATASLLLNHYQGRDRALAFAIWGSVAASAAALGPIVGGYLTTNYSWRWAFRINLIVVFALLYGARYLHEAREKDEKKEIDIVGILLSSTGLVSLVYGLIESSTYGWWKATSPYSIFGKSLHLGGLSITPLALLFGLALLGLFLAFERVHESKGHTPLVSLGLFKNRQFTAGATTTAMLAMGQSGLIFAIPIFYQSVKSYDALHTGLGLLPMSLAIMVGAPFALKLTKRFSPKKVIQMGFIISATGALYLLLTLGISSSVWSLTPGLLLYGFGMGFGFSQLSNLTLSAVSIEQSGEASGVNNTLRQIGASFGSAVVGAALLATISSHIVTNISKENRLPAASKSAITQRLKEAGSNVEFGNSSGQYMKSSTEIIIRENVQYATVSGNKVALSFTTGFAMLAFIVSHSLPDIRNLETAKKAIGSAH